MSLQYVIDGYNVINHPFFALRRNKKIRDQRDALISLIEERRLTGSPKNKTTVVFDGYPNPSDTRHSSNNEEGVKIVFSREESADEKIKMLVESSRNPKTIVVVTDDRQIQSSVKFLNAQVIGVEDFITRRERLSRKAADNESDKKVNYSQMHSINQELRKLWLKD